MSAESHSEDEKIRTKTVAFIQMKEKNESKVRETFSIINRSKLVGGGNYTQTSDNINLENGENSIIKINESVSLESK